MARAVRPLAVKLTGDAAHRVRAVARENRLPASELANVAVLAGTAKPNLFMAHFGEWLEEWQDKGRKRFYAAEDELGEVGARFRLLRDAQGYADEVCASSWWAQRGGPAGVQVLGSRDQEWAYALAGRARVMLPRAGRHQLMLLHEMSHLLQPDASMAHGPEYARLYCDALAEFMGRGVARRLAALLRAHGLAVGRPSRVYALLGGTGA